jgi:protein-S-isoprenylcysteine O-methyltransferase Ste14
MNANAKRILAIVTMTIALILVSGALHAQVQCTHSDTTVMYTSHDGQPAETVIPTLSEWGLILLTVTMAALMVWLVRRNSRARTATA